MSRTAKFSTKIDGVVRKYPHSIKGQQGEAKGVDREAAAAVRKNQKKGGELVVTRDVARNVAKEVADGGRVSAYEKPVHYAVIQAAKGKQVEVTDEKGQWRDLFVTDAGAGAYFKGVKGVKIAKGQATPAESLEKLEKALNAAAKDATYVSESDSTPAFVASKSAYAAGKAITGEAVMKAFGGSLASELDQQDGDLRDFTFEKSSAAELKEFWTDVTTPTEEGEFGSGTYANGWKELKGALEKNIKELSLFRIGPKGEDGKMASDHGMYVYLLVGRAPSGHLAGVQFHSVET